MFFGESDGSPPLESGLGPAANALGFNLTTPLPLLNFFRTSNTDDDSDHAEGKLCEDVSSFLGTR
jgi:hypothetical protein